MCADCTEFLNALRHFFRFYLEEYLNQFAIILSHQYEAN